MKKTFAPLIAGLVFVTSATLAETPAAPPANAASGHHMMGARMPTKEQMAKYRAHICSDFYAREVGHMACLEAKLSLSSAQNGAFDKGKEVKLSQPKEHSDKCATAAMPDMKADRSPLTKMTWEETMLKARLDSLQAERPALEALLHTLTDEQKKEFAQSGRHFGKRFAMGSFGGKRQMFWHHSDGGLSGMN